MAADTGPLLALADAVGVARGYQDAWGNWAEVSSDTIAAVLAVMGFDTGSNESLARELKAWADQDWEAPLQPVHVIRRGQTGPVPVVLPACETLTWTLELEDGDHRTGGIGWRELELLDRREELERRALVLPDDLPLGYHRLCLAHAQTRLIVVPHQSYLPDAPERIWGLGCQIYALRRAEDDPGVGNFAALRRLVNEASRLGAGFIGTNPLHAAFPDAPERFSPYSPSSRLFLNHVYLDVTAIPDFIECGADAPPRVPGDELVDYPAVAAAQRPVLERLYAWFADHHHHRDTARGRAFRRFRAEGGADLEHQALFEALAEHFRHTEGAQWWGEWPREYHDPDSQACHRFARKHRKRLDFFVWLQWCADEQLAAVQAEARRSGMPLGLYRDLAVGMDRAGAEAWGMQEAYALGCSVGAPPDEYNLKGQDWGLPPLDPRALKRDGYRTFAQLICANMRHAGALRIDHAMSLARLYWVPQGRDASQGTYVQYPLEDLLGVLCLESQRNRCVVIGEDLGTVPEGFRETMHAANVLSYRLLFFEKENDGHFRGPQAWEPMAAASVTTHDLPTLTGFLSGWDMELKRSLDLFPSEQARHQAEAERATDVARLGEILDARDPVRAAQNYIAATPCRLAIVNLDDALGVEEQVNMPGTVDEHPNWRRRLPVPVEGLAGSERLAAITDDLNATRPSRVAPPQVRGTYRLQFNAGFTFRDAQALVPYLAELGISHVYASPFLRARPGSTHGYDITDHTRLNPEVGDETAFDDFTDALARHGMGLILDFVPNHMGIAQADNRWWLDVLEWGEHSPYARHFDIDWDPAKEELRGKVLLPFLGDHYGQVLEEGHLKLKFEAEEGAFSVWYWQHRFPICPTDYPEILERLPGPPTPLEKAFQALGPGARSRAAGLKARLARWAREADNASRVAKGLARLNGTPGKPESFRALHRLMERQHWRAAYWRVAGQEINYRRFFQINDLAGIRVEEPALFEIIHTKVLQWVREGRLQGIRIDHVDGLFDPRQYLERLRDTLAQAGFPHFPVWVEKILAPHERLREEWPVAGTTGYDVMGQINGVQVCRQGEKGLSRAYRRFLGKEIDFEAEVIAAKHRVMEKELAGELSVLATDLDRIAESHWGTRDYTERDLRQGLKHVVAHFPVYRTFVTAADVRREDRRDIDWAVAQARKADAPDPALYDFIHAVMTTDLAAEPGFDAGEVVHFAMRLQQYTGPVMAKAMEDTAFYRYHRLVSLNEVGWEPQRFGVTLAGFHTTMAERAKLWPRALTATATHDTKRGEDVRARLNVLSEQPQEWGRRLRRWQEFNRRRKVMVDEAAAPLPNDEYLLYQTLVGILPPGEAPLGDLVERVKGYMTKALREAKVVSTWENPWEAYEQGVHLFIDHILDESHPNPFLADLRAYVEAIAPFGRINGLVQAVLKLTLPGVPDLYQGTELWELSLVDPDNRRPVDFALRRALLANPDPGWDDGSIKLWLLHRLLTLRRRAGPLFAEGDYTPLEATGRHGDHVLAFRRRRQDATLVVVVPRMSYRLATGEPRLPLGEVWEDTAIELPATGLTDVLTGAPARCGQLSELLAELPVAVLTDQ